MSLIHCDGTLWIPLGVDIQGADVGGDIADAADDRPQPRDHGTLSAVNGPGPGEEGHSLKSTCLDAELLTRTNGGPLPAHLNTVLERIIRIIRIFE